MERDLLGYLAGFLIATVTSPVGVSGAVFLLPVQLSIFGVPNPQVTPTNLLYNVLAGPGALLRYWRRGQLRGPLTRSLVLGSAPGVVIGAVLRSTWPPIRPCSSSSRRQYSHPLACSSCSRQGSVVLGR